MHEVDKYPGYRDKPDKKTNEEMLIIKSSERNEESVSVTFMAKAKATYIVVACCDADDYSG